MSDQARVAEFIAHHRLQTNPAVRMLDLVSEVGELAKEVLKSSAYGQNPFHPTAAWREELGDVYFALLCLAELTGVEMTAALDEVMRKYETRLIQHGDPGSGR